MPRLSDLRLWYPDATGLLYKHVNMQRKMKEEVLWFIRVKRFFKFGNQDQSYGQIDLKVLYLIPKMQFVKILLLPEVQAFETACTGIWSVTLSILSNC